MVGPDGKIKKACLLRALSNTVSSARVDRDGNIYVMEDAIPEKSPPAPPGFVKVLETERGYLGIRGLFGSIIKFPPTGGAFYYKASEKPMPEGSKRVLCRRGHVVEDSLWIRPYAAPVYGRGGHWCFCFTGRFDLDRYGRLFVPNAPTREVEVVDANGNRICAFGRYGNVDNGGPGSKRPLEGVPMNWGANVAVSDSAVYVADTNNRCVVKVRLDYRAVASCAVPAGAKRAASMIGMTVEALGEHIKKHHQLSDIAIVSVMGESAFEIFVNPKDKTAPKLVVSWSVNDEGLPAVESFAFTTKKVPALDDEDAVIAFCQKLIGQPQETRGGH